MKPTKGVDCKQKAVEFHQTLEFHPTPITCEQIGDLNNNVHDHDDELNIAPLATNNVKQKVTLTFKARTRMKKWNHRCWINVGAP